MNRYIRKIYSFFFSRPLKKIQSLFNKSGSKHECYVCGNTFNKFSKYNGGSKNVFDFHKRLNMVGSDVDNFACPFCKSNDRERHLFMFFDKIDLWNLINNSKILHFAPEKNLVKKILELEPAKHVMADFYPINDNIEKIDATMIPYEDDMFDLLFCNHVLEHIIDYSKAMNEIFRVLKPNGVAILQTPYSKLLSQNFEEKNINTNDQRLFFYGEIDHYRVFGEKHFFNDLKQAGFELRILKNSKYFTDNESKYYGVNSKEDLIQVIKPKQ